MQLFDTFKKNFPQLEKRAEEYIKMYKLMEVPAKTILLKEGEVSKRAFFIEKGCLRVWFNNNGKDATFQFFFENETVSSLESFRKNIPGFFTIETIEPSVVYWIDKKDLDKIMKELNALPEVSESIQNFAFERQYVYMKHFLSFIKDTPQQRYLKFAERKTEDHSARFTAIHCVLPGDYACVAE